jgi:hypothetical protein
MTDRLSDEEIGARVREFVEAGDDGDLRLLVFHETVPTVPGPLGVLLRQIAHAHNEYETARELYGTTEGEANRLFPVIQDAVALVESMRDGGAT